LVISANRSYQPDDLARGKIKLIALSRRSQAVTLLATLGFLGVATDLSAQAPAGRSDAEQISRLLKDLSDHTRAPSDVLDPSLGSSSRDENLNRFSAQKYVLSLVPAEGIPPIAGETASVPIRVRFDDGEGNSLDADATAHFVKRDGVWYFSSFDFMACPAFLVIVFVVGMLVAVSYAATALTLWFRLLRRGLLAANLVKIYIPFCWPVLFRLIRQTPPQTASGSA
jgi:hypothetical protein